MSLPSATFLVGTEDDRSTCPVDFTVPVETTAVPSVPSITSRQLARLAELEAKEQERELEVDDQADAVHTFLSQLDADVLASMAQDAMQRIKEARGVKRKISQRSPTPEGCSQRQSGERVQQQRTTCAVFAWFPSISSYEFRSD